MSVGDESLTSCYFKQPLCRLPHGWVILPPPSFLPSVLLLSLLLPFLTEFSHRHSRGGLAVGEGAVRKEARARGKITNGLRLDAVNVQAWLVGRRLDVQVEAADRWVGLAAVGGVAVHVAAQVIVELCEAVGWEAVAWCERLRLSGLLLVVALLLLQPVLLDLGIQAVALLLWHATKFDRWFRKDKTKLES